MTTVDDATKKAKKDERIAKTHALISDMNNGAQDVFALIAQHGLQEARERVVEDCVRLGNMCTQHTLAANIVATTPDQVNRKVEMKDCFEHCVQARNDVDTALFWLAQYLGQYKDKKLADKGVTNAVNTCLCTGKIDVLHAVLEKALPVVGRQFLKQVWTQATTTETVEYVYSERFAGLTTAVEREEGEKTLRATVAKHIFGGGRTLDKKTFNALVAHQNEAGKAQLSEQLWKSVFSNIQHLYYPSQFQCPEFVLGFCVRTGTQDEWTKVVQTIGNKLSTNSKSWNTAASICCDLIRKLEKQPLLFEKFAHVLHAGFEAAMVWTARAPVDHQLKDVLAYVQSLDAKIQKIVLLHAVEHTVSDVANSAKSRKI